MKKANLLIFIMIFITSIADAQEQKPVLGEDYNKYVAESEAWYASRPKGKGSGYKQYMRMRWLMDPRVNRNGQMSNFSQLNSLAFNDALRSKKSTTGRSKTGRSTHGHWEDLGPHDFYTSDAISNSALCRVNCIEFHPTNPSILWVGTPLGGLWKTADHGGTWQCITNNFASCGISDVVVNPANTNEIYVLTGDVDAGHSQSIGVMKTTDGGITWKNTGLHFSTLDPKYGFRLIMHPTNPSILFAAMRDGIYKTINAGEDWSFTPAANIFDVEFHPTSPTTIYAATNHGMFKSTNTGDTWTEINTGFPIDPGHPTNPKNWVRLSLVVSPSTPSTLYVLCSGVPAGNQFSGLYRSIDGGNNWVRMSNSPNILGRADNGNDGEEQADYNVALAVHPANSNQIFIGAINGWKSNDGGVTWSRETRSDRSAGAVDPYVHADWHSIRYRGGRIYSCNDGGVAFSDDFGNSWSDISSGLGATQFYFIDINGSNWTGGAQDNGTNEGNVGNVQMHNIDGGDGFGCTWHKTNPNIRFISNQSQILRRQDGINWLICGIDNQFWNNEMKTATNTNAIFFAVQSYTKLIRGNPVDDVTINNYSFYDCQNSILGIGGITGYSQGTNLPGTMYISHLHNIIKTTDIYNATPSSWVEMSLPDTSLIFTDIVCDPANANRVWLTCGGYTAGKKVYFSSNGGSTWTNITGSLPNVPLRTIEIQDGGGDRLYIGTEIGIFYREAGMTDWVYYSNNLPNTVISDLRISGSHIYAGTFGRGIWRSDLYTVCPLNLILTPANESAGNLFAIGRQEHSASSTIESTRQYLGSVGTEIILNGGDKVELKPGFELKKDAFLEVINKGCDNTISLTSTQLAKDKN